jgi:hypothetical protein
LDLPPTEAGDAPSAAVAAREMRDAAMESLKSIEKLVDNMDSIEDRDAIIAAVRQEVLADVEERVQAKADQLWEKGKHMLASRQSKHVETTKALADQVADCLMKQQHLEQENAKLKLVLADLTNRLAAFGLIFNQSHNGLMQTLPGPTGTVSNGAVADTSIKASPSCSTPPSELCTSAASTPAADATGKLPELPDVPDFPFPALPGGAVASPFLLSEALGTQKAPPTPLSLAESLSAPGSQDASSNKAPLTFSFTLRMADNATLGVNVSHHVQDRVLRVEGVRPEGAMEAWNRQCAGTVFAEKAVLPGDHIISVNSVMHDPAKMLEECRDKQLLKLTVVRNYVSVSAQSKPTTLRAEATAFVPMSQSSPEDTKKTEGDVGYAEATEPVVDATATES